VCFRLAAAAAFLMLRRAARRCLREALVVLALDAELVEAAVAKVFVRLTDTAAETVDRRQVLESEIAEGRRREQRLAEAISQGAPGDEAPEALLNELRGSRRSSISSPDGQRAASAWPAARARTSGLKTT
jgi:hypothetical protein